MDLLIHSCAYRHYRQSIPAPTHTMLVLLLFVAALIVGYLWCRRYERSARVRGTCTNFEREKTHAHRLKDLDNRRSTRSRNATAHPWERMYSSKFRLCSWSLLADFIQDHRRPSGSTGGRPVTAPGASLQTSSDLEIQGVHWTISQGEYNSLTVNINRKSFRGSVRTHLIEFYYLETTTC